MRILVACEFSGHVREAFARAGHTAYSCDLQPTSIASKYHIQGDVLEIIDEPWDLVIAFPPCTYLSKVSNRWYADRKGLKQQAYEFAMRLYGAKNCSRVAMENPVGSLSTLFRKPDQIIQPHQFGHKNITKATCLWLRNLPKLQPTNIVSGVSIHEYIANMGQTADRSNKRSVTFTGIANAMAEQWGKEL